MRFATTLSCGINRCRKHSPKGPRSQNALAKACGLLTDVAIVFAAVHEYLDVVRDFLANRERKLLAENSSYC